MPDVDGKWQERMDGWKENLNNWKEDLDKLREKPGVKFIEDILSSVLIVVVIAGVLWGISGVWPPMVAVKSPSMEPHMTEGDLIYVVEEGRFAPGNPEKHHGIVTYQEGKEEGYKSMGSYGDVIIYKPNGNPNATPVIHRAMKYVEKGEKWKGDEGIHKAQYSGFVTKGDNNRGYDQEISISRLVKPEWVIGKAKLKIPFLGKIRLLWDSILSQNPVQKPSYRVMNSTVVKP